MRPTQGRKIIPTHRLTIPVREITRISLRARTILPGPISLTIFTIPIIKQTFPVKLHLLLSKFTNREKTQRIGKEYGGISEVPNHLHAKPRTDVE